MWRHGLLSEEEKEELVSTTQDALWLLAVRNPCSWADGMFRKPYHMCPPDATDCGTSYIDMGDMSVYSSRLEAMQHSWADNIEAQQNHDSPENYTYANLFELRRHKLELMRTLIELFPHRTKILNLRQFELDADVSIGQITKQFKLQVSNGYQQFPEQPSELVHQEVCFSADEWEFAQTHIDWEMEGHFGFTPLDCHMCL